MLFTLRNHLVMSGFFISTAGPSVPALHRKEPPLTDGAPEQPEKDLTHTWIGAATVALDPKTAKHADLRGSYRTKIEERVDVLEVYCKGCRRPYDDVADEPCAAKINNEHLIGGNPGERKKRKRAENVSAPVPGPRINRMGVEAIARGGATFS